MIGNLRSYPIGSCFVSAREVDVSGKPAHLVAICQPGPLLISSLILNPHLGRTFGSAGSPMHTEAQKGFLTDFARLMGASYIDGLMALFGRSVEADKPGRGREFYDGTLQMAVFLKRSPVLPRRRRASMDRPAQPRHQWTPDRPACPMHVQKSRCQKDAR